MSCKGELIMKRQILLSCLLVCLFSFSVLLSAATENTMTVKDFALKLAKELNIDKEIKGDTLADIIKVFPENLQAIFNGFKGDVVTRGLAVEIFSYFLDVNEIDALKMAGQLGEPLSLADIDSLFEKSSKEGEVLTYITPPSHSFTNRLDTKLNEVYQTPGGDEGATDSEYPANGQ